MSKNEKGTHVHHKKPPTQLPKEITDGVLIGIPAHDRRMEIMTVSGLIQAMSYGGGHIQPYFLMGNSDVRAARNTIANHFLDERPEFETLVWVDSDIGFILDDFLYLMEGPQDLVVAPYARKEVGAANVDFGFGFVRMHRRVLQELRDWTLDDGQAALNSYVHKGKMMTDFFVNGPLVGSRWFGEDTGFFHFCAVKGIKPRLETRCRLKHIGPFEYGYPEQLPGFLPIEAGAQ